MIPGVDVAKDPSEGPAVSTILTIPPNTLKAGDRIKFKIVLLPLKATFKREARLKVRSHIPGLGT